MVRYVSIQWGKDGFGNQMFMMAAMLGYAERHGHTPVFLTQTSTEMDHPKSQLKIRELFPHIHTLSLEQERRMEWIQLQEHPSNAFRYTELPPIDGNVILRGCFQSELYFPRSGIPIPVQLCPPTFSVPELFTHDWGHTLFLHVRRGDYLHPANTHHQIPVEPYIRSCLFKLKPGTSVFLVSDDTEWCRKELPKILDANKVQYLWCPSKCSDRETMFWMTLCGAGGICANSSFSWWAAYWVHQFNPDAVVYMPYPWGSPPLPDTYDLYPSWAIQQDWRSIVDKN